jgi:hypothetical protein
VTQTKSIALLKMVFVVPMDMIIVAMAWSMPIVIMVDNMITHGMTFTIMSMDVITCYFDKFMLIIDMVVENVIIYAMFSCNDYNDIIFHNYIILSSS